MTTTHETTPVPVEAHQQQLVAANVYGGDGGFKTANPGDWIVKWPDGRLEVFTDKDFRKTFRVPPPPYVAFRGPHTPLDNERYRHPIINPDIICETTEARP